MEPEVVAALIGLFAVLISAIYGVWERCTARRKIRQAKKEHENHITIERLTNVSTLIEVSRQTQNIIFEQTTCDRFLLFVAFNGKKDFNHVTAIFEQRSNSNPGASTGALAIYRNITVDEEYKKMLKAAKDVREVVMDVSTMPDCLLKSFYISEGVKHSVVINLFRQELDKDTACLLYCSFATHMDTPFLVTELALMQAHVEVQLTPRLRPLLQSFTHSDV